MSDPAKDPDIEDVLASVRRLVTAERRDRPAAASALVLTPSQRIEKPSVAIGAAAGPDEAQAEAEPPEALADAAWEEDEPQDAFESWNEERLSGRAEPEPEDGAPSAALEVDAIPTIDGSADPAGETPEAAPEEASVEEALDAAEIEALEAELAPDEDGASGGQAPAFRHDPEPEIASVGPGSGHPLFEGGAPDAEDTPAEGYADAEEVDLEGVTDVDPDTVEDAEIVEDSGAADPMDVLDEETLRAMVADIVRQELRGPLGERITSNVRKLVRREIHRILAARDFE